MISQKKQCSQENNASSWDLHRPLRTNTSEASIGAPVHISIEGHSLKEAYIGMSGFPLQEADFIGIRNSIERLMITTTVS